MHYAPDDLIAAIASPAGGAARGIVRVSGPDVLKCIGECFVSDLAVDWPAIQSPQRIVGRVLLSAVESARPASHRMPLPCDLWFWPSARSYTRAPVAEFHTIGSPPLLAALLRTVCAAGAR